jgi:hypothetical protein
LLPSEAGGGQPPQAMVLAVQITRQFNAKKLNCEEILRLKIIAIKHYLFGNGRTVV